MNKLLLDFFQENKIRFSFQVWIKLPLQTYRDGTFSSLDRLTLTPINGVEEWYLYEYASDEGFIDDESDFIIHTSKIPSLLTNALKFKRLT